MDILEETDFGHLHFNFRLFLKEIISRGASCELLPGTELVECKLGEQRELFSSHSNRLMPANYEAILNDKIYSKTLLSQAKLPVARWFASSSEDLETIVDRAEAELSFPIVLKAPRLCHGYFVFPMIESIEELRCIWEENRISRELDYVIVEEHFEGDDLRIFLFREHPPACLVRTPPRVEGDGKRTLLEIIQEENTRRLNPRTTCLCDIYLDDFDGLRCIQKQGYRLDSIPKEGESVQLRYLSNVSFGGWCETIGLNLHGDYLKLASDVFKLFPKLPYAAIDLLVKDRFQPMDSSNVIVSELGSFPGFSLFLMPPEGESIDIISPIVDMLFNEKKGE